MIKVCGFTVSKDDRSCELVIHVTEDYDERYHFDSIEQRKNILNLMFNLITAEKIICTFYRVPEAKLRKYSTTK